METSQLYLKDTYLNKDISYTINTNSIRSVGDTNYICEGIDEEIQVKDFLKIKEVLIPANAKLLLMTYSASILRPSPRM